MYQLFGETCKGEAAGFSEMSVHIRLHGVTSQTWLCSHSFLVLLERTRALPFWYPSVAAIVNHRNQTIWCLPFLSLSLSRLERRYKLIQWQLTSVYPSLSFCLTTAGIAFAAIRLCRELVARLLLQCIAVNVRLLLTTFKDWQWFFCGWPTSVTLNRYVVCGVLKFCWWNIRRCVLNTFLQVVLSASARTVTVHFIIWRVLQVKTAQVRIWQTCRPVTG